VSALATSLSLASIPAMPPLLAAVAPHRLLYLAAALFAVGLVGVSCRRNVLIMLLSVEILLNAANVAFVGFSRIHGDVTGQVFVFFAMTIAAAEVAVGLAIVIALYRIRKDVDSDKAGELRERGVGQVPPIKPEGPGGYFGDGTHRHADDPHGHPLGGGSADEHAGEHAGAPRDGHAGATHGPAADEHGHAKPVGAETH
jgi:NADH-quinone oxidoreductase subunit K